MQRHASDIRHHRLAAGTGRHAPIPEPGGEDEIRQLLHDLKNPLASIALEVEILGAREGGTVTSSIDRIRRNVWYLDRLVYDLVDLFSLSKGHLSLHRASCDMGELLAAVIDRVVPAADSSRVFLTATEPVTAMVDEIRIERVVANLIDSALAFAPRDAGIHVRLTSEGDDAIVSLEPYCRASPASGRTNTDLGLYVSKAIVEAHRGRVGVDSARFFIALPR